MKCIELLDVSLRLLILVIFALVKLEIMRGARRIKTVVGLLDIITLALFLHWPGQSQQASARWTPVHPGQAEYGRVSKAR